MKISLIAFLTLVGSNCFALDFSGLSDLQCKPKEIKVSEVKDGRMSSTTITVTCAPNHLVSNPSSDEEVPEPYVKLSAKK